MARELAARDGHPAAPAAGDAPWIRTILTRLGVAISRRRAYGPSHPMVAQAEQALADGLLPALAAGRTLAIGVAHRELLVDGVPLEAAGLVARDLAERLHERGVGALTIQRGVTAAELRTLVAWLTQAGMDDQAPDLAGVTIGRIAYDRLVLADTESVKAAVDAIWRALAEAALSPARAGGSTEAAADARRIEQATAADVGRAIRATVADVAAARRIAAALGMTTQQANAAAGPVREELGRRLQQVLAQAGASALQPILRAAGRGRDQRRLIADLADLLPATSVVGWLETAARATGQEVSHHLLRILAKLSKLAGGDVGGGRIDGELRDAARDLVAAWTLDDPNPPEHTALLDQIAVIGATDEPVAPATASGGDAFEETVLVGTLREAARLVQMACEIDRASDDALAAIDTLAAGGRTTELLGWLDQAPHSGAADMLRHRVLSPAVITAVLLADPFDAEAARVVLEQVDSARAGVLLDALQQATSRVARRLIYRRLRDEGPSLYPELKRRLYEAPPWYVIRNLLALLRDTGSRLSGAEAGSWIPDVGAFQSHPKPQVRLEALRVLTREPSSSDAALVRALDDEDLEVQAAAVEATDAWVHGDIARRADDEGADDAPAPPRRGPVTLSRDLGLRLMRVVDAGQLDDATTVRAIGTLRFATGPTVRQWLFELASTRTPLLRRLRVAPMTPRVLAALRLLREQYASDPAVAALLARAEKDGVAVGPDPRLVARPLTPDSTWTEDDR